jgi:hypothetical protein
LLRHTVAQTPRAAKLKFKSSSIEWLVLSGPSKAALNGNGTINGEGGYEFLVSIIDGGAKGGGGEDQGQDHQKGGRLPVICHPPPPPARCKHMHLRCK